jgi:lysozyme
LGDVDTENKYPVHVFHTWVGMTVGQFDENWLGAKKNKLIRGAYHYYRPNENS